LSCVATNRVVLLGLFVALAASCATVDHSVRALPARPASAATLAPAASTVSPTVAPTTTASTVAPTTTTVAPTTLATTTTTVAPTTTTAAPTTTTVPAPTTTTIPKIPALTVPLVPVRPGAVGEEVKPLQSRLLDLGFWLDDVDGEYGWVTQQAVMAFQKTYAEQFKLTTLGIADAKTIAAMTAVDTRVQGTIVEGDVVEVDKARQVLFLTRGGKTLWALNTSTGSGETYTEVNQKQGGTITDIANTPEGSFKVYNEYTKGWEKGQLGELYRPKYFKGGVAIHGSNSIPNFPASHGCVRITTTAMDWIWANDLLPLGTSVSVHS
jgi:peptidoglycan hydrolase-like protein with peptidoglycan-binding domain